jgi:ankyrin repeat protein
MNVSQSSPLVELFANLSLVGNVERFERAMSQHTLFHADLFALLQRVDKFGETCVGHAARQGHAALLAFFRTCLLRDSARLRLLAEARNATLQTPLILAADAGQLACVVELVRHWHADVMSRDQNGYTALHCAAASDQVECIEFLLGACGADMLLGSDDRHTPLHSAATFGSARAVDALLRLGADVNAVETNFKATPLSLAVFNRHAACAELLLAAGADIDRLRNSHGDTAFDLAARSSPEIRALVDSARARNEAAAALRTADDDWSDIVGAAESTVAALAADDAELVRELDAIVVDDDVSVAVPAAVPSESQTQVLEALLGVLRGVAQLSQRDAEADVGAPLLRVPFC